MRRRLPPFVTLLAVVGGCWGVPRPAAPDRTPQLGLQFSSSRLENGLRVVLVRDPRAADVTVTMLYRAGSDDDPAGREGMAHLVEHVLYEPLLDSASLYEQLQTTALAFNGVTTTDTTLYTARAGVAQLERLLTIEAARLERRCDSVSEAAFLRQREIVRNELRERVDHDHAAFLLAAAVFPSGHPYHPDAVAALDTVGAITREDACAFADKHYAPADAVLVVGGPIEPGHVSSMITRTVGRVSRPAHPRGEIPPVPRQPRATIDAPITDVTAVIAWPLPGEPALRARFRAVVAMTASLVNAEINGRVSMIELGGDRARLIGLAVQPVRGRSMADALDDVEAAIKKRSQWFGTGLFEAARERAVHDLYATLEPGVDRDLRLATDVLAGRDIATSLPQEIAALRGLGRQEAAALADRVELGSATVVIMRPKSHDHGGSGSVFTAPAHDVSRVAETDPAEARTPATFAGTNPFAASSTRVLGNGVQVVLLPLSSVPTVDVRLVFPAGTGDEPPAHRGVAMLAAHGLELSALDGPDMLRFFMAGGQLDTDVDIDQTTFSARGLGTQLDVLLTGLSHLVRNGTYDSLEEVRARMVSDSSSTTDDVVSSLAWRTALYGTDHPYVAAGLWERAAPLDLDAVRMFQRTRHVPQGATLIIAGGFDPAIANQWIDYVFAEWAGRASPRRVAAARLQQFPFARQTRSEQVTIRIALPTSGVDRATALVVTDMIDQAVADVRQRLAASYGLSARWATTRMSTAIVITGAVDAQRAAEAFTVVRDSLRGLQRGTDETARRFVLARRRVIAQLVSVDVGAAALAERAQRGQAVGRPITDDLESGKRAAALTLPQVEKLLGELDLANAAILLSGPRDAVTAAYATIDRRPIFLGD